MRGGGLVKDFVAIAERPSNGKKVARCDWNSTPDEIGKRMRNAHPATLILPEDNEVAFFFGLLFGVADTIHLCALVIKE